MAAFNVVLVFLWVFCASSFSKPLNTSRTLSNGSQENLRNSKFLPQDHVKGLKLERDGHVNKDYHHEAFLGKMVDDGTLLFDNMDGYRRLIDVFHKVDRDGDHAVSKAELTVWIHEKIKEHIQEARENNNVLFKAVDENGDGFVTWDELSENLKRENATKEKEEDKELDDAGVEDNSLTEWYHKFRRGDMNLDDRLDVTEYLYFQHPEHNPQSIKDLVDDMIFNFDRNHDKVLTKTEFLHLPPGDVDTQQEADLDNEYVKERESEFQVMDEDGDGIVTQDELTKYLDPTHEQRAVNEANYLITMADRDHNGLMDEKEMLMNYQLFTGSSMSNYAGYLHDEF